MKESKFIELLNLYVDHQISPAEAEQLEAEVKANPERRRVYREYCEMQKGCAVLAENFRSEAPDSNPKLVEFKPRRLTLGAVAYVGSLVAVAACVAVVLTMRTHHADQRVISQPVAVVAKAPAPVVAVATTSRPALQPAFGPKFITLHDVSSNRPDAAEDQVALTEWMNNIQLSAMPGVSADDLHFDAHATLQPDARTYRSTRPISGKVEWTAYSFQK